MCRYYLLWGCIMLAFGFGIIIGLCLEGGFFAHCLGLLLMVVGAALCKRK